VGRLRKIAAQSNCAAHRLSTVFRVRPGTVDQQEVQLLKPRGRREGRTERRTMEQTCLSVHASSPVEPSAAFRLLRIVSARRRSCRSHHYRNFIRRFGSLAAPAFLEKTSNGYCLTNNSRIASSQRRHAGPISNIDYNWRDTAEPAVALGTRDRTDRAELRPRNTGISDGSRGIAGKGPAGKRSTVQSVVLYRFLSAPARGAKASPGRNLRLFLTLGMFV
jgi:hypothetical protein